MSTPQNTGAADLLAALEKIHATLVRASVPSSHRPKGRHVFSQKQQVAIAAEIARAAIARAKGGAA